MLFIQIGQCGIQCGQEIIKMIYKNNKSSDLIKELLIDTESKVLNAYNYKNKNIKSSNKKCFQIGKDGSGNNWSLGYCKVNEELINSIMDSFSSLVESIDLYKGLNFVHSIAGGTGSGLFSRIIEEIKNRYPKTCISSYSIFPFESGENSLQYYNSIFSLSWLQKYSDVIYSFSNKEILNLFNKTNNLKNYSLNDINTFISNCASGLYPFGNKNQYINTWDIIYNICPIPSMKMLKVYSESTLENLVKIVPNNYNNDRLISGRLSLISQKDMDERLLNKLYKRIGALSDIELLKIRYIKSESNKIITNKKENDGSFYIYDINSKSRVSLLKNSTDILSTINNLLSKSEYLYKNKAFWSYFKKYNEDIDELFIDSYNTLFDCKNNYNEWHNFY